MGKATIKEKLTPPGFYRIEIHIDSRAKNDEIEKIKRLAEILKEKIKEKQEEMENCIIDEPEPDPTPPEPDPEYDPDQGDPPLDPDQGDPPAPEPDPEPPDPPEPPWPDGISLGGTVKGLI
jgi:hypothetical protein